MSVVKQVLLSLVVVLIAGAGWYAWNNGYLGSRTATPAQAATGSPGAGATGGAQNRGPQAGGGAGAQGGRGGPQILIVGAPVTIDNTGVDVRAIGTVAAERAVTLYPEVSGFIVEAPFKPGTRVNQGQTVIRLDDSDQRVALDKAKIALDAAKSARERAEQLAKSNNITTVALADARTTEQKAQIDVQAAQNDLDKRTLSAPFAGTIGLSNVTVGDLVSSAKPIATLDDMTRVTVSFEVPERASGLVAVGQSVTATTEALAGQSFTGKISAVDSRVDATARTLAVEATLPNDANVLKPGMALTVSLSFPGQPHPSVPSLSVQWDRNGSYVWKVDGNVVHRVAVQIVGRRSGTVIVTGELAEKDEVVVEGLQRLREGVQVTRAGGEGGGGGGGQGAPGQNNRSGAGAPSAAAPAAAPDEAASAAPAAGGGEAAPVRRPPSG
jgi:RND family efflux transporter MFP subunit